MLQLETVTKVVGKEQLFYLPVCPTKHFRMNRLIYSLLTLTVLGIPATAIAILSALLDLLYFNILPTQRNIH